MKLNFTLKTQALLIACILTAGAYAQQKPKKSGRELSPAKCGTTEYEAYLRQQYPSRATEAEFEQWLAPKASAAKMKRLQKDGNTTSEIVTIPVVVHIIHNGDPVGTNENIADDQVISQITVLNQDFRKLAGTPGYNDNAVGADMEIEFCLAQQDPEGLPTNGIVRHYMNDEDGYYMYEINNDIKPQTQWDPEKYFNIWVVDAINLSIIPYGAELTGYSQFPATSGLPGLEEQGAANTDGIVIGYKYFGSVDIYPEGTYFETRDKGRIATHETGHFFGLRHIWGDANNCSADDYCQDTPIAFTANSGCPAEGHDSCPNSPGNDMVENYMDYTNDACQNIFTQDQKDRMQAVLQNSPRRASLITSPGCIPGVALNNDGTLDIQNLNITCSNIFEPSLILKNSGLNTLTSAAITYRIDNEEALTYNWSGNLEQGEEVLISLPELTTYGGAHTFYHAITSVNGSTDQAASNDAKSVPFSISTPVTVDTQEVIVNIQLDAFGSETMWALIDGSKQIIASGGPYTDSDSEEELGELITQTIAVENNECYTFAIFDLFQDGICCEYGEGYYTLTTPDATIIAQGGDFAEKQYTAFGINVTMDNKEIENMLNSLVLYPNPSNKVINISVPNAELPENYTIYNSLGQVMGNGMFQSQTQAVDVSGYANGVYFIKVNKGDSTRTLQFVKY